MKKPIIPALALTILQNTASAAPGTATGPTAIAQHSPAVRAFDKRVIARLFRGNTSPNTKICVDADSAVCRVTDVDITSRSCDLSFGSRKRTLTGHEANELPGAPSQGAAGSSTESASKLRCTIDPNEIMRKTGGGATCTFDVGP